MRAARRTGCQCHHQQRGVGPAVELFDFLLDALRNTAASTATKKGRDVADRGACTVILDGKPGVLLSGSGAGGPTRQDHDDRRLQTAPDQLHPLQESFMMLGGGAVWVLPGRRAS